MFRASPRGLVRCPPRSSVQPRADRDLPGELHRQHAALTGPENWSVELRGAAQGRAGEAGTDWWERRSSAQEKVPSGSAAATRPGTGWRSRPLLRRFRWPGADWVGRAAVAVELAQHQRGAAAGGDRGRARSRPAGQLGSAGRPGGGLGRSSGSDFFFTLPETSGFPTARSSHVDRNVRAAARGGRLPSRSWPPGPGASSAVTVEDAGYLARIADSAAMTQDGAISATVGRRRGHQVRNELAGLAPDLRDCRFEYGMLDQASWRGSSRTARC